MTAALQTTKPQELVKIDYREKLETIKQTVAKGATDAQLEMFLTLCNHYQLDPFLREVWFVPNVGVVTGRDGYLKVALRDPDYDGIVSAAVCKGDTFEMKPVIPDVKHEFGGDRGAVIGAYAIVFHKHRRPAVCFAPYAEYSKSSAVWTTYKSAMICKVAEALALKRQFGISGLVTEEEIGAQPLLQEAPKTGKRAEPQTIEAQPEPVKSEEALKPWKTRGEMKAMFKELESEFTSRSCSAAYDAILKQYGVMNPERFANGQAALECYNALWARLQDQSQSHESVPA